MSGPVQTIFVLIAAVTALVVVPLLAMLGVR